MSFGVLDRVDSVFFALLIKAQQPIKQERTVKVAGRPDRNCSGSCD